MYITLCIHSLSTPMRLVRAAQTRTAGVIFMPQTRDNVDFNSSSHTCQADDVYNTKSTQWPSVLGSIARHQANKIDMEAELE